MSFIKGFDCDMKKIKGQKGSANILVMRVCSSSLCRAVAASGLWRRRRKF